MCGAARRAGSERPLAGRTTRPSVRTALKDLVKSVSWKGVVHLSVSVSCGAWHEENLDRLGRGGVGVGRFMEKTCIGTMNLSR
jgi:hypothetical protein